MDKNEFEYNKHTSEKETERILKRRDREKYLEELAELESEEASYWNKILWNCLSLLIIEPVITAGVVYYLWSQIIQALNSGAVIANLGSQLKWAAIGIASSFALTSLTLLYYLWKVADLKNQIVKIKRKVYRLDRELSRQ